MKIVIAKTAGFCMGVRRAVELALDAPSKYTGPIYTYGPLIHNPQVLAMFNARGVTILDGIPPQGTGTVLVRAHGVPPAIKEQLKQAGFTVINATCPRVVKVQSIIKRHARKKYAVIIVGDRDHPEVISLLGFAGQEGHAVGSLEALQGLPTFEQAVVVAQTTQNQEMYQQVKAWTAEHRPHYKVFDTICDSTEKRQAEVLRLARDVEAVVVVGGKDSGNTRRLAEIVRAKGKCAYHVETEADLDSEALSRAQTVGITAGASTPSWIIRRVVRAIEQMPTRHRLGWRPCLMRLQRLSLLTNVYVALGAGCLCYASTHLQHLSTSFPALIAAVLYVMSMHILNHLTGRAEDSFNDPDRERFYSRHKLLFTVMAMSAGGLGLVAAFKMGLLAFWTLLAMSLLGLSYNLRLLPAGVPPGLRFRRIRDLPGSKTILIALAWGVVTAGLPALADPMGQWIGGVFAVGWAAGLAFTRTAFFDILDMQGDRIVGKETIPILLGPERALLLLRVLSGVLLLLLCVAAWSGIFSYLALLLTVPPAIMWATIAMHQRGRSFAGLQLEFMVESLFVLAGLLTFFYGLVFG
jgi:(E)-4-hydroxy-3-methyl-but-2-enyl pyrophosphate reductase